MKGVAATFPTVTSMAMINSIATGSKVVGYPMIVGIAGAKFVVTSMVKVPLRLLGVQCQAVNGSGVVYLVVMYMLV